MTLPRDSLQRFTFDRLDIRGELVWLDHSWTHVLARHDYPATVQQHLGAALAAVALLSVTVKFAGTMVLQVQGTGPLRSVVAQATHTGKIRGLARWRGLVPSGDLHNVFGQGQMLITIMKDSGERYQSIVALEGNTLADALNRYFDQSEQLASTFRLFVQPERVGGCFLQALPTSPATAQRDREEDWQRINLLTATLQQSELFTLPPERLLLNLFHEEEVHIHPPKTLAFACTCSREKVERTLIAMGLEELRSILHEEGSIDVDCEFCNQHYRFGPTEVEQLFQQGDRPTAGTVLH